MTKDCNIGVFVVDTTGKYEEYFSQMVIFIWVNKFSIFLFGITIVSSLIAIITIPGYIDCLQDSDCTVNDVTDSMFQKYISGFSLIGGVFCFAYLLFFILFHDEENTPDQRNQSYPKLNSEYSEKLLGFSNDEESMKNQRNESSPLSNINCISCGTKIDARNLAERSARGVAGAGTGSAGGMIIGTIVAPGVGTLIGGALGLVSGASAGRQVSDICNNCCSSCVSKKEYCKCHEIIGLCRLCGCNITSRNSSDGYCHSCSDSLNGEDV